jgi:GxxExxY protein
MNSKSILIYETETFNILGACFEVYKELGNGYLEPVYQECLQVEFAKRQIPFISQPVLELSYKEVILQQTYKPDFICYDKIIVELKAISLLLDEHKSQVLNYLKATNLKVGLLINFGHYPLIQHLRLII